MNRIYISNEQDKYEFSEEYKKIIKRAVNNSLKRCGVSAQCEISVVITDNENIRVLNREHRNIDRETDVLSFPLFEAGEEYGGAIGDIVISLEKAVAAAEEYGHSVLREVAFLTVHSMLHLLGYDHEEDDDRKKMNLKEDEILDGMGVTR